MFKYLLIARVGSGRKTFCKALAENANIKIATQYTEPNNDIDPSDIILKKETDAGLSFYSRKDIESSDIIPLDPDDIEAICSMFPDTPFRFINIMASNEDRIKFAVADADDKITAEEDFIARCAIENEAFIKFENAIKSTNDFPDNITIGHVTFNDFTETSGIYEWESKIIDAKLMFKRVLTICKELAAHDCLTVNEDGTYHMFAKDSCDSENDIDMSPDIFVENVITETEGMATIMGTWLTIEDNSFKDAND